MNSTTNNKFHGIDDSGKMVFVGWSVRAVDPTGNAGVQVYTHTGHNAARDLARTEEYLNTWGWSYEVTERWVPRHSGEAQVTR